MLFNKQIKDITRMELRYTYGNNRGAYVQYILMKGEDGYGVSVKVRNMPEEDRTEFEVSREDVLRIEELLNKYKAGRWDGFSKSNKHVLDGNSFEFSVKTSSGVKVSARGYMSYPANYKAVRDGLDAIFTDMLMHRNLQG